MEDIEKADADAHIWFPDLLISHARKKHNVNEAFYHTVS